MAQTFVSALVHIVFSTKERRALISDELRPRLWAYLGGIARQNGFKAIIIGGTADHVHILLSLPSTTSIAKAVQLLKGGSSKWVREQGRLFSWQSGYGAFTVGMSQQDSTVAYINSQAEHHMRRDFQQEFLAFLSKHKIEYDPRYVWG